MYVCPYRCDSVYVGLRSSGGLSRWIRTGLRYAHGTIAGTLTRTFNYVQVLILACEVIVFADNLSSYS